MDAAVVLAGNYSHLFVFEGKSMYLSNLIKHFACTNAIWLIIPNTIFRIFGLVFGVFYFILFYSRFYLCLNLLH